MDCSNWVASLARTILCPLTRRETMRPLPQGIQPLPRSVAGRQSCSMMGESDQLRPLPLQVHTRRRAGRSYARANESREHLSGSSEIGSIWTTTMEHKAPWTPQVLGYVDSPPLCLRTDWGVLASVREWRTGQDSNPRPPD